MTDSPAAGAPHPHFRCADCAANHTISSRVFLIVLIVAIVSDGSRSIGAGLVCVALAIGMFHARTE